VSRVNDGEDDLDAELTADIVWDRSADGEWSPIGKRLTNVTYNGEFDGQGYKISGLYANYGDTGVLALFYGVGAGGVVRDLTLDVDFTAQAYVAGVAVNNAGTIERVTVYGSITSTSSTSSGMAGGISAASSAGSVFSRCVNSANLTSGSNAGGIVGADFFGTMKYCANYGTVTGATAGGLTSNISNTAPGAQIFFSYNAGHVKGGGLFTSIPQTSGRQAFVVSCFSYGRASMAISKGNPSGKASITNFADVYYLKASGNSLFGGRPLNGTDGWGAEENAAPPIIKERIIEKSRDEFAGTAGSAVLALLDAQPDDASAAYPHYEAGAWRQGARYPVLAEITVPDVDKSSLEAAIAEAESLLYGAYSSEALAALTSALSAARDVWYNENLTQAQTEIDEAAQALRAAVEALEPSAIVKIRTAADLAAFAARVEGGEHQLKARLAADIVVGSQWSAI
jgi:hypothetical protein